jgi:hypothetical protein
VFSFESRIARDWLVVPATISVHSGAAQKGRRPPRRRIDMMLDTGATGSTVHEPILRDEFGLIHVSEEDIGTAFGGSEKRLLYAAVIEINLVDARGRGHPARFLRPVIGGPVLRRPYKGILGLDILRAFQLVVDGPRRVFSLSMKNLPPEP